MTRQSPSRLPRVPLLLAAVLLAAGGGAALAEGVGVDSPAVTDVHWGAWRATTVSWDGSGSSISSIAVAPDDTPYIAYHTFNRADSLRVVHRTDDGWVREVLPIQDGSYPEVAVADDGSVHVAFQEGLAGDRTVYYAHRPAGDVGSWGVTLLDSGSVDLKPALALGPGGMPSVSYIKDDVLRYAEKTSSGWSIEDVGPAWSDAELVLDSEGDPRIAYAPFENEADVAYAEREDGTWSTQTVEPLCGFRLGIALDPAGDPHIACGKNQGMAHVWRDDGGWHTEIVDDGSHAVFERDDFDLRSAKIAVDEDGRPHIGYRYTPNFASPRLAPGQPHYAVKVDGEWRVEIPDRYGQHSGLGMDIALDSDGYPHLSYVRDNRFEDGGGFPGSNHVDSSFDIRYARPGLAELAWKAGS